ncbi:hypothetical protein phiE131_003 [Burkholderia phage phiE131]|uniref:hypothetical protein n=1 Tax=Burkholderia thailandensis TaxID=57975 RepID=UPI000EF2FEDC|nr:hypothetical protein [Burkholderia thailandensis]AYJ74269.1 hypothetical protein phiE131_003 [Burkholderia phage phiE131]AYJ74339.1 hypothetical protein phiE058_003 [Burkholderia phage phiE058]NOK41633.1 hypothetical protein [Burkholderia thailandensis]NOK49817.1 hypothetical protein [Burkholderia thailandensis]
MRTRTFIAAILGFAQPHYMADLSTSAVDLPIATDDHDASATPASDTGESSGGASAAADVRESDTSSFAAPASLSSDTAAAGGQQGDAGNGASVESAAPATFESNAALSGGAGTAVADPTPTVTIDVEDHAEARERFAGLLARLHGAEEDFVHALRNELNALGTLLHLHTVASGKADATGYYSSSDLS